MARTRTTSPKPSRRKQTHIELNGEALEHRMNDTHDAPLPLLREVRLPAPYPVDALGPELAAAVRAVHNMVQSPIEMCAQSGLAVVAVGAQSHIDICLPHGQIRPTALAFGTIASSGERKSATDSAFMFAVEARQTDLDEEYIAELEFFEAGRSNINRSPSEFSGTSVLKVKQQRASRPKRKMISVANATTAGLLSAFESGQSSMALMSDEGGSFLGGSSMAAGSLLKTAAILSKLYDGSAVDIVRGNRDPVRFRGRRMTTHLMVQVSVGKAFLSNAVLQDQGLLSRMLFAAPEPRAGSRPYRDLAPEDVAAFAKYQARTQVFLELPARYAFGSTLELKPRVVQMTSAAKALWVDFYNACESELGPGGRLAPVTALANKIGEHAARLAAVIAFYSDPNVTLLDDVAMARGIELAAWYLEEALRLADAGTVPTNLALAVKLRAWLHKVWPDHRQSGPNPRIFRLQDVYQYAPDEFRSKAAAETILGLLVENRWVRALPRTRKPNGHMSQATFEYLG